MQALVRDVYKTLLDEKDDFLGFDLKYVSLTYISWQYHVRIGSFTWKVLVATAAPNPLTVAVRILTGR